jgi:predicted nucleotidyltransferase
MKKEKLTINDILQILRQNKTFLEENFKVKRIGVFGSYVKGLQHSESDIDIIVQIERPMGFVMFLKLEKYLTELLGKRVDLLTFSSLKPYMKDKILREVKYV